MTANIIPYQAPALPSASTGPLLPNTIGEAVQVAELMAKARMIPDHLRGSVADCFLVVNQARLWRMDPFSLAQGTSFIHGKMMYEGKVIAAIVHSLGNLSARLSYEYNGEGDNRAITVSGTLRGEDKARTVSVKLRDARTTNKMWTSQPDQQLAYYGARVWARRHVPEVIQGVYAPEDFPEPTMRDITPTPAVSMAPLAVELPKTLQPSEARSGTKPPLLVNLPDGWEPAQFPRTGKGLKEALEFLAAAVLDGSPSVVPMNMELLDTIAEKMPALADEVANLRAAAAEAMAPKDEPDNFVQEFLGEDDTFPGDLSSKAEA